MKTIAAVFLILFVFFGSAYAQKVNEKLLDGIPANTAANPYDLKYDSKTGSFSCTDYKEGEEGIWVVTSKGKSRSYYGALTYNALFDDAGNAYTIAYDLKNDSVYTYYILKNSGEVTKFDFINENWDLHGGIIYFTAKENGKNYFVAYDIYSGGIFKSNPYDDVMLLDLRNADFGGHGMPPSYVSYTGEGKPYYLATLGDKKFLVIAGIEQKYYSDIDFYNITNDKKGVPVYVAYENGQMGDSLAQAFVVQGTVEYKKFRTAYGPFLFDSDNSPVYVGGLNGPNLSYPEVVMSGNKELSKTYDAGINSVQFTSSGKLAFIGSVNGKSKLSSYIVVDQKESPKHGNSYGLTFSAGGVPEFVESDGDFEYLVVGDERISGAYGTIPYHKTVAGKTFFIGTDFSRSKDNSDAYFDGDKLASFAVYPDEGPMTESVLRMDDKGNYLLVANKRKKGKEETYEDFVYTAGEKLGPYAFVSDIFLYKGKPLFTGQENVPQKENLVKSVVYYNSKPVTIKYDNILNFTLDEKTGIASFIGVHDSKVYYVELSL